MAGREMLASSDVYDKEFRTRFNQKRAQRLLVLFLSYELRRDW